MKRKLSSSKIVLPVLLLLVVAVLLIGFRAISAKENAVAWYAPLADIPYHSDAGSSSGDGITFLLHDDGNFELSYGQTTCHGQFEADFPQEEKVLSPTKELYSFSFRTPCAAHPDHTFYFTIYPNDLNSFTVNVETPSTDAEMLWLTADNSAAIHVPASIV